MKIILEDYSELFDVYLAKGELPEYAQGDVLAKYIKDVLDDPGNHHLCTTDPVCHCIPQIKQTQETHDGIGKRRSQGEKIHVEFSEG